MFRRILPMLVIVATALLFSATGQANEDRVAVLAAVQQFFDTMQSKDAAAARNVLDPEGSFVSVRWEDGKQVVRRSSMSGFLERLESMSETLLERMWEPEVLIHRSIAIVWTRYDFYRDGELSHCGVDAFQLTKLESGWMITGGTYTVEPTGCPESPLGPPR